MKKIIATVLAICTVFVLCSCHTVPDQPKEKDTHNIGYYPCDNIFTESETRVVFVQNAMMQYYNKVDGGQYIFCFDPMCSHDWYSDCVATKFMLADMGVQTIEYCEYNHRFYALRGKNFCSFDFDGKDIKIEYAFGPNAGFDEMAYTFTGLGNLNVIGKYAYMMASDELSGKMNLMRYDVERGKMETVYHSMDNNLMGYVLDTDCIYIQLVGEHEPGIYKISLDGEIKKKISDDLTLDLYLSIFDGTKLYMFKKEKSEGNSYGTPKDIVSYNVKDGTWETLYAGKEKNNMRLLAVTEKEVYFTKDEPVLVQASLDDKRPETNTYSRIYAIDKETKEIRTALDNDRYSTRSLFFYDDMVLIGGSAYEKGKGMQICVIPLRVDENGNFCELNTEE